jgi:dipeptidyl aminopeptidase/acylaminoacyl peptidase
MSRKLLTLLLVVSWSLLADKRPLNHNDYDPWRHIQNQVLSADGHYLAYAVFPQAGDGEVVVRDLKTGKEVHQPAGELPPPPPPNYATQTNEETPPLPPGVAIKFSSDSQEAAFLTFAPHADVEKAKREKRKPDDMPKGDLVVVQLNSGAAFRVPRVTSFQLPTKSTGYIAYLQVPEKNQRDKPSQPEDATASPRSRKPPNGDLVLRSLKTEAERRFPEVGEYTLTRDGSLLVYAVASKKPELSGVYSLHTEGTSGPAALLSGNGKYEKLSWDEAQTQLAFVSDHDDSAARQPLFKLYTWDGKSPAAAEIVSVGTPNFPADWVISDKATITIAKGGNRIFFGTAPKPPPPAPVDTRPADERVSVDLWSWKDDHIQPMQKVRASVERSRSYRALYDLRSRKFVQLGDPALYEVTPAEDGAYAIGGDDREYRRMEEYDQHFEDTYLIDTSTGSKKLVVQKRSGRISWSPDSRHAIYFDGKDWMLLSAPDSNLKNLTAQLGVSFGRELYDEPGKPPAVGPAIWTKDGRYALVNDNYDIWRFPVDGGSPVNITQSFGAKNRIAFRIVRFERDEPSDRFLDPSKPLLLRAENQDTRDSGFYRTTVDASAPPVKLIMAAKNFAPAIKAHDAEVYVTAQSTFSEYPDLRVTDGTFAKLDKVTDLGSQFKNISWGTAELIHFKSADGIPLQGTLYKPENFNPQKKYPMIVYIYERLTQNLNNFIEPRPTNVINPSYYVSNGYLVLEPDIAYKVGYPGQSALDCVLPAVQEIVDRGFVNEKAIGIQGHSWGGYQIAYMVTRTNRFRAAAPGAPVANMISAYDGIRWGPGLPRQFQYEHTQSRIGGTVWDYPLRYIENSPIFMADRVNTPLLMIHNDADDAVPWYQGIEYYLALRRLNKEVYLFSYNGEPHNLRRRPNQKDYTVRLQQFFDYYLKGASKPDWMEHGIPFIDKPGLTATDSDDQ